MTKRQKLIDHLANLLRARDDAFANGEWDRVDLLGNCIDDTRDQIAAIK
jgi:hypothetical protein